VNRSLKIGVLGLQGAYQAHQEMMHRCGVSCEIIREASQLNLLSGLIIPGGESTTMTLLMKRFGLFDPIVRFSTQGKSIFGTCAGMILLAKNIKNSNQETLGLMDITIERNAYGRQSESFIAKLDIPLLEHDDFSASFIRAPRVSGIHSHKVKTLAVFNEHPVLLQQQNLLAASFHPELSNSIALHQYFIKLCGDKQQEETELHPKHPKPSQQKEQQTQP
jgi:pyridoxal 5'-phosphate synthase pdxT subunit